MARRACEVVRERFANWSMDLIFGAPPVESWVDTLETCRRFNPLHVSAYGLTYEDRTPFARRKDESVDDETYLRLFWQTEEVLSEFVHYEVSNLARPGYACRHNLIYWQNLEYAGFGPAAYSFLDGVRSRNLVNTDAYLRNPGAKAEALRLSDEEIRVETVIQHLRLRDGLFLEDYAQRFGRSVYADFSAETAELVERGLVEEHVGALRPTRRGFEMNNEIGLALVHPQRVSAAKR